MKRVAKMQPCPIGAHFAELTVLGEAERLYGQARQWSVRCDCGAVIAVDAHSLRRGHVQRCPACRRARLAERNTQHGQAAGKRTPEYQAWRSMITRCRNPHAKSFADYGARGIDVATSWLSFETFFADMGPRPGVGYSLERKNNDLGYSSDNCRWATVPEQNRNRRDNIQITHDGLTLTAGEWADRLGLRRSTLYCRLRSGVAPKDALSLPIKKGKVISPQGRAGREEFYERRRLKVDSGRKTAC